MHGHLVAIKVRVVRGANQRMNPNRLAFDQHRLKGLYRKTVQRGSAVQQHRMPLGYLLQNIPHLGCLALNQFLGRAHRVHIAELLEAPNDERLEQHKRHLLGQTALMQLQLGTNDDHRATGVIHTFAEEVLAETTALALKHIRQTLERAIACPSHSAAMAAIVK